MQAWPNEPFSLARHTKSCWLHSSLISRDGEDVITMGAIWLTRCTPPRHHMTSKQKKVSMYIFPSLLGLSSTHIKKTNTNKREETVSCSGRARMARGGTTGDKLFSLQTQIWAHMTQASEQLWPAVEALRRRQQQQQRREQALLQKPRPEPELPFSTRMRGAVVWTLSHVETRRSHQAGERRVEMDLFYDNPGGFAVLPNQIPRDVYFILFFW